MLKQSSRTLHTPENGRVNQQSDNSCLKHIQSENNCLSIITVGSYLATHWRILSNSYRPYSFSENNLIFP